MLFIGDPGEDLRRCAVYERAVHLDAGEPGVEGASGSDRRGHVGMRSKLLIFEQPNSVHGHNPAPQRLGQAQRPLDRGERLRRCVDTDISMDIPGRCCLP